MKCINHNAKIVRLYYIIYTYIYLHTYTHIDTHIHIHIIKKYMIKLIYHKHICAHRHTYSHSESKYMHKLFIRFLINTQHDTPPPQKKKFFFKKTKGSMDMDNIVINLNYSMFNGVRLKMCFSNFF